ncbi:hypothetical protein ACFY78_18810 [Streptomyces olindensis]|uniref:hypothetical protein n=1 Tax=Streptomyces olindensis TaxID=358823 RepID=UPI0036C79303
MTISPLALEAKKVIDAAWMNGPSYDLSSQAAFALESTCMLQSPETAAETMQLREQCESYRLQLNELSREHERVVARLAEYERPVDEDPIRYTLTERAEEHCDHPNGYGPNGCAGCGSFRPDEDDATPQVLKLRALLAGQRDAVAAEADGITRRIAPVQALRAEMGGDR